MTFQRLKTVLPLLAFGLCVVTTSAGAETKTTTNWNAGSFAAACAKSDRCTGGPSNNGQGFDAVIQNDETNTTVQCSSTRCTYTTSPNGGGGGGSPARVAKPDKALGTGVSLGGLLAGGAHPTTSTKADVGQRLPKTVRMTDTPKIETPKPARVDVPKIAAPTSTPGLKDTKVNAIR